MRRFNPRLLGLAALLAALAPCGAAFAQGAAAPVKAPELSSGDTAWLMVSTGLVLLMTPGLALFYAGMVRAKNVLNVLMQSFVAMSVVTILWVVVGYSIAFAPGSPFLGGMDYLMLKGVGQETFVLNGVGNAIPHQVFMAFQMMFAIITPALISGAIAERMKFGAYVAFITLWSLLVYSPLAHMVWGEGGFFVGKALDFAGGTVVHISSGFSALALAILLGKRRLSSHEDTRPHNLPMTLIGTGLLWVGWYGFNAGSAVASNGLAGAALVTTHIAAATAGFVWMMIEWVTIKKPTALGFASGAVAGLVAITPAAGFVTPASALIIGGIVSFISFGMIRMKAKFGYDDTLDVFAVHGCGGVWGALATGIFADKTVNAAGFDGVLKGNVGLLGYQAMGAATAAIMGVVGTLVIAMVLKVLFKGIAVTGNDEEAGLDITQHGESGYVTAPDASSVGFSAGGHGSAPSLSSLVTEPVD